MTTALIAQALEIKLDAMLPALATAWENTRFTPTVETPYQAPYLLWNAPIDSGFGDGIKRQAGYMQVKLCYPLGVGRATALARAEALRSHFYRGLSLVNGAVTVIIDRTPVIEKGYISGDRYVIDVFVYFFADIGA